MKLIDHTPLQDENGEIGIIQRVQGTLKYGLNWYSELEAQKFVLAHLERALGKGYTVIRNYTLGASGIIVPLILVGPAGIYAIHVTNARGQFQAKGDSWGVLSGTNFQPASVNLLTRTQRLARALQAFIERQGVKLPQPIESVLFAANPGMHVESVRPIVRVVMVDALDRWAATLIKAAPVLSIEAAHEFADRIVNPRPPKKAGEPEETPPSPQPQDTASESLYEEEQQFSNAGSIFQDADEGGEFNPSNLGFAFEEDSDADIPENLVESGPATPRAQSGGKKRILGMTTPQLALLGGIFLVEICVLIGFAYIILSSP
jgi:hypothetical protein